MQSVRAFLAQFYCRRLILRRLKQNGVRKQGMKQMKFLRIVFFCLLLAAPEAGAVNMVQVESYLNVPVSITGLPDFPPFAYYESTGTDSYTFRSIFAKPVKDILKKYNIKYHNAFVGKEALDNVKLILVKANSGEANMFMGAYSDTKLFTGLEIIFPAVVANPVHLIVQTDSGIPGKIRHYADLKDLKGVVSKTEYFSDFVLRKLKELNITYVNSPYEAYESVITGKADYMLGSMYYNRIMASRYGVGDYLAYSKNPVFKIPVFVALSKVMPVMSEYKKMLHDEFSKPEFADAVKQQILDMVNAEVDKNAGVVPPSFIKFTEKPAEGTAQPAENSALPQKQGGHIVKKEVKQKTVDEVLDGI